MKIHVKSYRRLTPDLEQKLSSYRRFNVSQDYPKGLYEGTFEVGPHIFDDQLVTTCGKRIFDWADYMSINNRRLRWGHYVVNIEELDEYRRQFYKCGFCGHMETHPGWCTKCRGSEYLKPKDYPLLKLRQLTTEPDYSTQPPADVLASIKEEQAATARRKAVEWHERTLARLEQKIRDAETEREFINFAIDKGLTYQTLQNCIFYSHTGTFCFGWSTPLTDDEIAGIKDTLGLGHPYPVEFKHA